LSNDDVAARTGLSKSSVSRIERDLVHPTPESLQRLAAALGVVVDDYMLLAGYTAQRRPLPELAPYLRSKYDSSDDVAAQVEAYFRYLQSQEQRKRMSK
jgi:transcriptional regulator with XRE-family HTH domain